VEIIQPAELRTEARQRLLTLQAVVGS
jgi:hypothetical protein